MSEIAGADGRPPLVQLTGLSKTFGGNQALDDVSLTLLAGEVHGLVGENGSGKSTLIKVLSGYYTPDPGASLTVNGNEQTFPIPPGAFRDLGIAFVHQDLALVPELTVVENLCTGSVLLSSRRLVSWRKEAKRARRLLRTFGLDIDPTQLMGELGPTDQALIAIIRAVEEIRTHRREDSGSALLILDEPTVFLPREGTDLLFELVRSLVSTGDVGVLLVSHDLDEILEHTDRVTVFRDGRLRGSELTTRLSRESLVEAIVGRPLSSMQIRSPSKEDGSASVRVRGLSGARVAHFDVEVDEREIVGLTGLAGSGYDDVLPLLFGATQARAGEMQIAGETVSLTARGHSPNASMKRKIAYIPADRKKDGSVLEFTVEQNMMLPMLSRHMSWRGLRFRELREAAALLSDQYDVRPRDVSLPYGAFSGGNQQKAMLAKWFQLDPRLILLQEPTQGVDIGARSQIFDALGTAAKSGAAILCASSDYEQLALICDRVIVMGNGRIERVISGSDVTKENIAETVVSSSAKISTT